MARSVQTLKSIGEWILGLPPNETCLPKKIMSQASTRPVLRITHMLALIAFSELYITVSRQQATFLSNRCINEMHYTYQITRRQVSSFASPRYDFASKHISRKMLPSSSFFFSLKEN